MKKFFAMSAAALSMGAFALDPGGVTVDLSLLKGGADVGKNAVNLVQNSNFETKSLFTLKDAP